MGCSRSEEESSEVRRIGTRNGGLVSEGWKARSTEAREPSEETARSMGMPQGGNSSAWNDFSSWLEVEDDWEEWIQKKRSPGGTAEPTQVYLEK